jgi:hypothetical protein
MGRSAFEPRFRSWGIVLVVVLVLVLLGWSVPELVDRCKVRPDPASRHQIEHEHDDEHEHDSPN